MNTGILSREKESGKEESSLCGTSENRYTRRRMRESSLEIPEKESF